MNSPEAFCEPFDRPDPTPGTRSGDLNGVLWGVSRATSMNNPSQGQVYNWAYSVQNHCGTNTIVAPDSDVRICKGQMVESVNDNAGQSVLAAYPRQPFDWAGRTGTVEFDVSNNSQGEHAAWPAFVITDQPVPAPYGLASGIADNARNSVGLDFFVTCQPSGCGPNEPTSYSRCLTVSIFATADYQLVKVPAHLDGCVLPSPGPGTLNHVELQINAAGVRVFASDPGNPGSTRLIADSSFHVPLSRGLVWLDDVHYNADKFNFQQTNTFTWDNLAFDGPILPRDLGFDIPDRLARGRWKAQNGLPTTDLGYLIPAGGGNLKLVIRNVSHTAAATGALLEMTYWPDQRQTISYSVNGHPAHKFAWPFGNGPLYVSQTVAMPLSVSEVHDGNNTITLSTSDTGNGVAAANYDLILEAAGGTPTR